MTAMVMTVTYEVETGDLTLFRAAVTQHAETTRQREVGCTRYEVGFGAERRTLCFTYGVFESADALDHHTASDHFHLFDEVSKDWVISRTEQVWELAAAPRRPGAG